jgi:hypothetical protein
MTSVIWPHRPLARRREISGLESAMHLLASPRSLLAVLIFIFLATARANAEPAMWVIRDSDSTIYLWAEKIAKMLKVERY